jgi:hypothetical protein
VSKLLELSAFYSHGTLSIFGKEFFGSEEQVALQEMSSPHFAAICESAG